MPITRLTPNKYVPTQSRGGNNYPTVYRGKNGFLRGRGENTYFECYGGSLDLNETISAVAITGTLTFSTTSKTITGTGTAFHDELHLGQMLITPGGVILSVAEILSNTTFIAHSLPIVAGTTVAAYRLHILFEFDRNRGTLLSGNAYEADTGNILAVGSGVFRRNGQTLTNSLTASRRAKIAILDGATQAYTAYELGFSTVPVGITPGTSAAATSKTFTNTDVSTGAETITIVAHGYNTGQAVNFTVTGADTIPAPLVANTAYYLIRIDADTLKVAALLQDAVVGTAINLTSTGSGTITVKPISKNMPAATRGLRFAKASTKLGQDYFGNPSENVTVTTTTVGDRISIPFPAMDSDTDPTSLHDAWRVYGTLSSGSVGVWYYIRTVTAKDLGGTGAATYYLEYLDGEAAAGAQLISFDNEPPVDAEFVASVTGYPVLVSCQGKATATKTLGTSPGVSIVPFKVNNLAAAPLVRDSGARAEVPTSPPETIIGFYLAAGRLYLLTANSLPIAVFTADNDFPIATRPFWKSGFRNPYAVCFVQGRLYGFTTAGALRSVADGEEGSEEHSFAADVEEITKDWDASRVLVCHDPKNECICFIYGGAYQKNGFWGSIILPFMLRSESWSLPVYVESATRDLIITGAATVGGNLDFLAGGRNGASGYDVHTYRFDGGLDSGETVFWQLAWGFSDEGDENRTKTIKYPAVIGKTTDASLGIFGTFAGEAVDVAALETGNSASKTGAVALVDSSVVERKSRLQVSVSQLSNYAIGVEGTWAGAGMKDRIDEVSCEVMISGARK